MSLIGDALQTAERLKSERSPSQAYRILSDAKFFPAISPPKKRPIALYTLFAAASVLVVAAASVWTWRTVTAHRRTARTATSAPAPIRAEPTVKAVAATATPAAKPLVKPFVPDTVARSAAPSPSSKTQAALAPRSRVIAGRQGDSVAPRLAERAVVSATSDVPPARVTTRESGKLPPAGAAGDSAVGAGGIRIAVEGGSSNPSGGGQGEVIAQEALAAQQRGDVITARDLYQRAIAAGAVSPALFNNLGALERAAGELDAAAESYRRALAIDQRFAPAWVNLGVVLAALGKRADATAAFQQALSAEPTNVAAKVNLAQQYQDAGATSQAERLLGEVVKSAPDYPEGHYSLGQLLEARGDRKGAVREFNEFLRTAAGHFPQLEERVRKHVAALNGGSTNP